MNNSDLIIALQNLREKIYASNNKTDLLINELKVNNLIELNKKGFISDEVLKSKLMEFETYNRLLNKKENIKAKLK